VGFKDFLQNLGKKPSPKKPEIPYADFRRVTKTGKVRAKGTDERRGWFGADKAVARLTELSQSGKKVYNYLSRTADNDGYCFPFYKTIAKRCSISESTVSKAIRELDEAGLLTKRQRVSRRGGSSNLYQLRRIKT
jgi:DNA-binding transcriptional ArsR family regulator